MVAPPCRKQGPFEFGGERTQYPHVNAARRRVVALQAWCGAAAAPAGRVLAVVLVLAVLGGGAGAVRLSPSARRRRRWSARAATRARATTVAHERFGDDAVYVLVRGDLPRLVLTSDLNRLLGLEGCLSGNVPGGRGAAGRRGRRRARRWRAPKPVRVVYGPGTFINSSVEEITTQLQAQTRARAAQADRATRGGAQARAGRRGARAAEARRLGKQAEKLVYAQFARELLALNAKYGLNLTGAPKLNDPDFVYQLVFDPARGARDAEGAVRVPVPVGGLGADLGAAEGRAERCASARGRSRWCAPRWRMPRVAARRRRRATSSPACRCWRAT